MHNDTLTCPFSLPFSAGSCLPPKLKPKLRQSRPAYQTPSWPLIHALETHSILAPVTGHYPQPWNQLRKHLAPEELVHRLLTPSTAVGLQA